MSDFVRGIRRINELADIYINEEMYDAIEIWKFIYIGYYKPWHDIRFHTIEGEKRRRMDSLNMAKVVSSEMASLVFDEKCEISASDEALKANLEMVFKQNDFHRTFQKQLEYSFAMGGLIALPYVDNNQICISYINPDCFIPVSWSNDMITEGVFINETRKGKWIYTHLSWHMQSVNQVGQSGYTIKNQLFRRDANIRVENEVLGTEIFLGELYPGLDEIVDIHPLDKPLFSYFKPNIANNVDLHTPLGISLYANALHTMHAIDTAFDSLHREFRLGKKKIMVPVEMIKTVVDPQTGETHRYFDTSDETFVGYKGDMDPNGNAVKDISAELRVEEHIAALNALLDLFAMQTGFSSGTFIFDGQSVKTATEVISENSKTFKSKKSHEIIVEAGLKHLIGSIIALAGNYELFNAPDEYEITIQFDDSIIEDRDAELQNIIQEVSNNLTPRKIAIMRYHGLTEEEADQWMQDIAEENANAVAEQMDMFGMGGQNAPPDDEDDT